jgi:transmembrane 9 superfamily protein 2/4
MKKDNYSLRWIGFPVGFCVNRTHYIFNHMKFTVLVHRYDGDHVSKAIGAGDGIDTMSVDGKNGGMDPRFMVVGFEVVPCSYRHNIEAYSNLEMYGSILFPLTVAYLGENLSGEYVRSFEATGN